MIDTTPILGFAAFSGTGKTTLLKKLITELKSQGLRLAVIKHAHHDFEIDIPGKDSFELREAGAEQVLVSSQNRFVRIQQMVEEKTLSECISEVDQKYCDLILVEGYKKAAIPKIELHRSSLGFPLLCQKDKNIIALATDSDLNVETSLPMLDLNNTKLIASFVIEIFLVSAR